MDALPRSLAAIERGIADRLHLGAQLYVSLPDRVVADAAVGEARPGVPMTTDRMIIWWSMTKSVTVVATGMAWERGLLDLDDTVASHVPEFGVNGKDRITVRHLLTHTGGFRQGDMSKGEWAEHVAAICEAPMEPGWVVGETAGYHLQAGMIMLAEIIRRADGRPFSDHVRDEIFGPLGMDDCFIGMPADRIEEYRPRIGTMFGTATGGDPVPLDALDEPDQLRRCNPAGTGRGPMNQLGRMIEMLRGKGERDGVRLLSPQTVEAMAARHRVGEFDKTFRIPIDWGLGFIIDSFAMGRHCSRRTFGHGGMLSSLAMCDPVAGLVATIQCNGMPTPEQHQRRMSDITSAIYEDLGLAEPGAPGREKEIAAYA